MGFYYPTKTLSDIALEGEGLISQTAPRAVNMNSFTLVDGTTQFTLLPLRANKTITNIIVYASAAATNPTLVKLGLYSTAGVRLAVTNDVKASFNAAGAKVCELTAAYTPSADGVVYAAILATGGTPPGVYRGAGSDAGRAIGSGAAGWAGEASQTDLDATATLAANAVAVWFGVS